VSEIVVGLRARVKPPFFSKVRARAIIPAALWLSARRPSRLEYVLTRIARGARPANEREVLRAIDAVISVSKKCSGRYCLQRSVAVALYCRGQGVWPDWHAGAASDPFRAHAWVSVDGRPVREVEGLLDNFAITLEVLADRPRAKDQSTGGQTR
jgi:hypothetical protein